MMKPESITIILPLPARVLSPNCPIFSPRGRMMKAAAAKRYRRITKEKVEDAKIETSPWDMAEISVTFFHKVKRRRDSDNYQSMLKSAYDGLVDAKLLVDDDSKHLKRNEPMFEIDKLYPRVEMTVERIEKEKR